MKRTTQLLCLSATQITVTTADRLTNGGEEWIEESQRRNETRGVSPVHRRLLQRASPNLISHL